MPLISSWLRRFPHLARRTFLLCWLAAFCCAFDSRVEARNEIKTITLSNVPAATTVMVQDSTLDSAPFAPGVSAATVQTALASLSEIGPGNVTVTGGSSVGQNVALNAPATGTASDPANLVDDDTGSTSVFGSDQEARFDLGAGNTFRPTTFRAYITAKVLMLRASYVSLYGSDSTTAAGDKIGEIYLGTGTGEHAVGWRDATINSTRAYRYYRIAHEGWGSSNPLTLGGIKLNMGSGYYGTYTATFIANKSNLNVPDEALSTSTAGVSIGTTTQGTREWTVGSAIQGGTLTSTQGTAQHPVPQGGTTTLQVTGAVDLDHWEEAGSSGDSNDFLIYTWSGPGTFTGTGGTGESMTWTAPAAAGTYTLTCTIDDLGVPPYFDAGTTNDAASPEVSVDVVVKSHVVIESPTIEPSNHKRFEHGIWFPEENVRDAHGSINLDSVADWFQNLAGEGTWGSTYAAYVATTNAFANPEYSWTISGAGTPLSPSDATFWSITGPTKQSRFNLGGDENGFPNSTTTITVHATDNNDVNSPIWTNHINVTWHLPWENFVALAVRPNNYREVFPPTKYSNAEAWPDASLIAQFDYSKTRRVGDWLEGASAALEMISASPRVGGWAVLLQGLGIAADELAEEPHSGQIGVQNNTNTWNESVELTTRNIYPCVPPNVQHSQCVMVKPLMVVHYDEHPYDCDEYGVKGYIRTTTKVKRVPAQPRPVWYAGEFKVGTPPPPPNPPE